MGVDRALRGFIPRNTRSCRYPHRPPIDAPGVRSCGDRGELGRMSWVLQERSSPPLVISRIIIRGPPGTTARGGTTAGERGLSAARVHVRSAPDLLARVRRNRPLTPERVLRSPPQPITPDERGQPSRPPARRPSRRHRAARAHDRRCDAREVSGATALAMGKTDIGCSSHHRSRVGVQTNTHTWHSRGSTMAVGLPFTPTHVSSFAARAAELERLGEELQDAVCSTPIRRSVNSSGDRW